MEVGKCCQCPLCFNENAFPHWTLLRQALVSLTTRSFSCILCGVLCEGLEKYVLHLVSHDIFKYNNKVETKLVPVQIQNVFSPCSTAITEQSPIVSGVEVTQPASIETPKPCQGSSLVDLLDDFSELFHQEQKSESPKLEEDTSASFSPQQHSPTHAQRIFPIEAKAHSPKSPEAHNWSVQFPIAQVSLNHNNYAEKPPLVLSNFNFNANPLQKLNFTPNRSPPQQHQHNNSAGQTQCDICGWNYDNENFLKVHKVLMHSNQRPAGMLHRHFNRMVDQFPCRECHEVFKNSDEFESHLKDVHNDHRFVCPICAKIFKLKGSLLVHQRVVHQSPEGEGHHCKVCRRRFVTKYHRDVHQKRHDSSNPFECASCGLAFNDPTKLASHMEAHTTDLKCNFCGRHLYTKLALNLHLQSHQTNGANKPIKQEPTTTTFPFNDASTKELVNTNGDATHVSQITDSEMKVDSIQIQNVGSPSVPSPSRQQKNQECKYWECDVCKKAFTTKYFLRKHKRLHTGETPYACHICGKSFTFQQSYHKHMLYHTDNKPYSCSQCGRAFKELSTLQNHERIHSGERPFACETCGKSFRQRVSYLVHRRIHTGVMPYDCLICGKSFRYKVTQRTHKCLPVNDFKDQNRPDLPVLPKNIQEDLLRLRKAKGLRKLHTRLQNVLEKSKHTVDSKLPSPLGHFQQLTLSESTQMDDTELTRQKILDEILSEDRKSSNDSFESILNPIYFDFSAGP